ncbi:MAG: DUF2807 domain-containing protein [Ferruginibacter sp.]
MKKLITTAVAILITACIAAFAGGETPVSVPQKHFNYQLSFTKIVVSGDIDLQLKEDENKIIDFTGNDGDVENADWKIKDDALYLKSKKGSLKGKVHATINVSHLSEIVIKGESTVSTAGYLVSPGLHVYIQAECFVAIKNAGEIYIVNSNDIDIGIKKVVGEVRVGR